MAPNAYLDTVLNALTPTDVALLLAAFFIVRPLFVRFTTPPQPQPAPAPAPALESSLLLELTARIADLETKVQGLPSLWETHEARVKEQADLARRSAARIEQAARRAEERRAERDEESELELGSVAAPLHQLNGARGREVVVPALPANVAQTASWTPPHKRAW